MFNRRIIVALASAAFIGHGWTVFATAQQPTAAPRNSDSETGYAGPQRTPAKAPQEPPLPAPPAAGTVDPPQNDIQQEREWLVAYLIAHQGYRIDQMDDLEKRIGRMSATQVQTMVDLYRQKHELALQREKSAQQMRSQVLSAQTADYNRRLQQEDMLRQERDAGAQAEQSRLNQQQSQAMQNYQLNSIGHQPNYYGGSYFGYGYGGFGGVYGGMYHDRYWH